MEKRNFPKLVNKLVAKHFDSYKTEKNQIRGNIIETRVDGGLYSEKYMVT